MNYFTEKYDDILNKKLQLSTPPATKQKHLFLFMNDVAFAENSFIGQ